MHMHGHYPKGFTMKKVRAYKRSERKRLIVHVLAENIRKGIEQEMTCAQIARAMDIVASTKLREILTEMVFEGTLDVDRIKDAGIAGFRCLYKLNNDNQAFSPSHGNKHAIARDRVLRLNSAAGTVEVIF